LPSNRERHDKTRRVPEKAFSPNLGEPVTSRNSCSTTRARAVRLGAWWQASLADRCLLGCCVLGGAGALVWKLGQPSAPPARRRCPRRWFSRSRFGPRRLGASGDCAQARRPITASAAVPGSPRCWCRKAIGLCRQLWPALNKALRCGGTTVAAHALRTQPPVLVGDRSVTSTAIASWPRQALDGRADLENREAALDRCREACGSPRRARQGGGRSGQHLAEAPIAGTGAAAAGQGPGATAPRDAASLSSPPANADGSVAEVL